MPELELFTLHKGMRANISIFIINNLDKPDTGHTVSERTSENIFIKRYLFTKYEMHTKLNVAGTGRLVVYIPIKTTGFEKNGHKIHKQK